MERTIIEGGDRVAAGGHRAKTVIKKGLLNPSQAGCRQKSRKRRYKNQAHD
jgi:hypothetical protein